MKRAALVVALVFSTVLPAPAFAFNLGEELRKSFQEALKQAAGGNQEAEPRRTAQPNTQTRRPSSERIVWQVREVSSGIREVSAHVPESYDLANPETAARVYLDGCRAGGGGGWFGTINAFQNGRLVADGSLSGCQDGSVRANFIRNTAAQERAKEQHASAHAKARESDQRIGNMRGGDADLSKELNAQVAAIKSHPSCKDGCKDFKVFCNVGDQVANVDKANGIQEKRYVGIEWLRFGVVALPGGVLFPGGDKRWNEDSLFRRYVKMNGRWKMEEFSGWDPSAICRRGRP